MRSLGLDAGSALSAAQRFKQVAAELKRRDRRDRQEQQALRRQARQLKRVSDATVVCSPLLSFETSTMLMQLSRGLKHHLLQIPHWCVASTPAGLSNSALLYCQAGCYFLACQTLSDGCCHNGCLTEYEASQVELNRRANGQSLPAAAGRSGASTGRNNLVSLPSTAANDGELPLLVYLSLSWRLPLQWGAKRSRLRFCGPLTNHCTCLGCQWCMPHLIKL